MSGGLVSTVAVLETLLRALWSSGFDAIYIFDRNERNQYRLRFERIDAQPVGVDLRDALEKTMLVGSDWSPLVGKVGAFACSGPVGSNCHSIGVVTAIPLGVSNCYLTGFNCAFSADRRKMSVDQMCRALEGVISTNSKGDKLAVYGEAPECSSDSIRDLKSFFTMIADNEGTAPHALHSFGNAMDIKYDPYLVMEVFDWVDWLQKLKVHLQKAAHELREVIERIIHSPGK